VLLAGVDRDPEHVVVVVAETLTCLTLRLQPSVAAVMVPVSKWAMISGSHRSSVRPGVEAGHRPVREAAEQLAEGAPQPDGAGAVEHDELFLVGQARGRSPHVESSLSRASNSRSCCRSVSRSKRFRRIIRTATAVDRPASAALGLTDRPPADLVDRPAERPQHVDLVDHQPGLRQEASDGLGVRRERVDGHLLHHPARHASPWASMALSSTMALRPSTVVITVPSSRSTKGGSRTGAGRRETGSSTTGA